MRMHQLWKTVVCVCMCVRSERKKWDVELSPDLCHVRCACMAGQKYLMKFFVFVFVGDGTGVLPGSPSVVSCLFFPVSSLLISHPNQFFIGLSLFAPWMVQFKPFNYSSQIWQLHKQLTHRASKRKDGLTSLLLSPRGTTSIAAFKFTLALTTISIFCIYKVNFIANHEPTYQILMFISTETQNSS